MENVSELYREKGLKAKQKFEMCLQNFVVRICCAATPSVDFANTSKIKTPELAYPRVGLS
jgi:hypothetical protein